jgi:SAM-dependent methyltransferase
MDRKGHWEDVYQRKDDLGESWFQERPDDSLLLIRESGLSPTVPVIDVGGGTSRLVDGLLALGFSDITVLDIAGNALDKARDRIGPPGEKVQWLAADVTIWSPPRRYSLWHDRAVFHFLTEAADRTAYRRNLEAGLMPGGIAVMASFALDGPERCSGLPVMRYSPDNLAAELGAQFQLLDSRSVEHFTPAGRAQRFQYSVFRFG